MKRRTFLKSVVSISVVPFIPVLKDESTNKYIFRNIEAEGCELIFRLEGTTYELEDGKTYELSSKVVNHLSSLKVFGRHRFFLIQRRQN